MSLASRQTLDTDGDEVYASSHASAIRRRPMPTFLNASVQKILHDSTSLSNDFSSCASQNGVKAGNHPHVQGLSHIYNPNMRWTLADAYSNNYQLYCAYIILVEGGRVGVCATQPVCPSQLAGGLVDN